MAKISSRYTESIVDVDGQSVTVSTRLPAYPVKYTNYLSSDNDSFESIAAWAYNDPTRWWEIADVNTHVKYPNYIPVGTYIRVPSL